MKFKVFKRYEATNEYLVEANSKQEAEDLAQTDGEGAELVETYVEYSEVLEDETKEAIGQLDDGTPLFPGDVEDDLDVIHEG